MSDENASHTLTFCTITSELLPNYVDATRCLLQLSMVLKCLDVSTASIKMSMIYLGNICTVCYN